MGAHYLAPSDQATKATIRPRGLAGGGPVNTQLQTKPAWWLLEEEWAPWYRRLGVSTIAPPPIRQIKFVDTPTGGTSATTIAATFANAVLAGSTILVLSQGNSAATSATCSDSVNGSYPAAIQVQRDTNASSLTLIDLFCFQGSLAGTPTVTVTFNVTTTFRAICIVEVPGVAAVSLDKSASQIQAAPGTGSNAVTSGNTTNLKSLQNVIVEFSMNTTGAQGGPIQGTDFANLGLGWSWEFSLNALRVAAKNVVLNAPTTTAGTFTVQTGAGSERYSSFVVALMADPAPPIPTSKRQRVDPDEEPQRRRLPPVAAILAPAPAAPDTVLRAPRRPVLAEDDWALPRERSMIAAVIAVATASTFVPPPRERPPVDEPEQTFLRPRPDVAAILAPAPAAPDTVLRPHRMVVDADPHDLPPHRPDIAAVLAPAPAAPDTVLRQPGRSSPEDPEYLPRGRPLIAAITALVVGDTFPHPLERPLLLPDDDALPERRMGIAAAIAAPDTILRGSRARVDVDVDQVLPGRRIGVAAILPQAPQVDTVLRPLARTPLLADDDVLPGRRPAIAAAIAAPDTILRPARPDVLLDLDDVLPARRTGIAAVVAVPPADTVLRPIRVSAVEFEHELVGRRRAVAAILAPAPAAAVSVSRPPPRPPAPPDEDPPWMRRPPVAAITAPAPAAPNTVLRPVRPPTAVEPDHVLPGRRLTVAAILPSAPAADTVLRPFGRAPLLVEDDPAPPRRPVIAAVAPAPPAQVPTPRGRPAIADLDELAPRARPQIAAVLAPAVDFVSRAARALMDVEPEHVLARPRARIAASLPPPADFVPRPNPRPPVLEAHELPPRRASIAAILAAASAPPPPSMAPGSGGTRGSLAPSITKARIIRGT